MGWFEQSLQLNPVAFCEIYPGRRAFSGKLTFQAGSDQDAVDLAGVTGGGLYRQESAANAVGKH
jgi:hypothetical protein